MAVADVHHYWQRVKSAAGQVWNNRLGRWTVIGTGAILASGVAMWAFVGRDLPSAESLLAYEPPLPSHVRAIDGTPIHSFARERRVYLTYEELPETLIGAFLSAEDKTFFQHSGLDYLGIASAVIDNIGSNKRPRGASTITQQVAKNLLLTNELSYTRKLREAIIAKRMEATLSKQQILELYLNQIFLGRNAYGVQAASRAYFDKDVADLGLSEIAFLAVLPKAPNNYSPERHAERALERRNWVLRQMASNGYISAEQRDAASREPLGTRRTSYTPTDRMGAWFIEDVRRELIDKFGETAEDGPNSVYAGGLWVRTSIDPAIQKAAEQALRDGLVRFDRPRGWRGASDTIELGDGWDARLRALNLPVGYDDWRAAVVLSKDGGTIRLGFEDGKEGRMPQASANWPRRGGGGTAFSLLKPGDVIPVKQEAGVYALRQIPEVSGGMVVQDPHTGRILAMVGGFDNRRSEFNRATQAMRQSGSAFKPFVYAAALENGMTPASIIVDGPFCVYQSAKLGNKCFRNFAGGYAGPQTMRWGLEQSRNLMTVRTASQAGMDNVVKVSSVMKVGDYPSVLAISLGAGETTVMRLVNGYSMLVNGGKDLQPTLIDMVQDRHGKIIFQSDTRPCEQCNAPDWNGKAMPRPPERRKQAIDAMTAYQVIHMLEGVVERGTATRLRDMDRPLFGKTGTTSGPTNAWFVGGSADLVAGVYIGYDQPRSMGSYVQGGNTAVPIWKQWAVEAMKDQPKVPFLAPPGMRMVRIDRRSGRKVFGVWPSDDPKSAVIWEAFKPESEPRRVVRRDRLAQEVEKSQQAPVRSDSDFLQSTGGIY